MARQLLEVVQHHQAGAAAGDGVAQLQHWVFLAQRHIQALGHGADKAFDAAGRGQIAEPHATGKVTQPLPAKAHRDAGLAAAADAQQRHQARAAVKAPRQLLQRGVAADKGVALGRQAVACLARGQPQVALLHHAVDLVGVRRRGERSAGFAHLQQLQRRGQALHAPVAMRDNTLRDRAQGIARGGGDQGLSTQRGGHHAGGQRFADTVHLQRLGAQRHIGGRCFAHRDRADMQPGAGAQAQGLVARGLQRGFQFRQRAVVGQHIGQRIRGLAEHQQEAVGLVDLTAVPLAQQVACDTVVRGPDARHGLVAQALREAGAVHQIGEQQGNGCGVGGGHQLSPRTGKSAPRCSQFSGE